MGVEIFRLDGRVALVTGGSGGLGRMMALALAEAGAKVAVTSRHQEKAEQTAVAIAEATGQETLAVVADVTAADQVEAMVQKVVSTFSRIDILINSAGINVRRPVEEFDEATWNLIHKTNVTAPFLCAQAVAPYLKAQRSGRVINVASMLGLIGLAGRSAYCASKGGVIQFTRVLALEWAPYNITVNALCPGPFATELNTPVLNDPQANQFFIDHIPLKRWGQPEELKGAALFLASDASSFMTGASLVIDGGWTAE